MHRDPTRFWGPVVRRQRRKVDGSFFEASSKILDVREVPRCCVLYQLKEASLVRVCDRSTNIMTRADNHQDPESKKEKGPSSAYTPVARDNGYFAQHGERPAGDWSGGLSKLFPPRLSHPDLAKIAWCARARTNRNPCATCQELFCVLEHCVGDGWDKGHKEPRKKTSKETISLVQSVTCVAVLSFFPMSLCG